MTRMTVLSERPFRLLWLAATASSAGSAFASVALAFAALDAGGTATSLGLVLTAGAVAQLAFQVPGGVWSDRLPKRRVMITADVARMLAQAGAAFLLFAGAARVWELMLANVIVQGASAFFRPASSALIASTISAPHLQEANAVLSIGDSTAQFAGPALSGLLVAAAGPGWSFVIDSASFGLSAALLAGLPAVRPVRADGNFAADLAAGWREVASRRWCWLNLIVHALWNLGIAVFLVLGPVVSRQRLGGAAAWGVISAGMFAGAIAGGLIALRVHPRRPLVAGNLALIPSALPLLSLEGRTRLVVVVAAAAISFAGLAFLNSLWRASVQRLIPVSAVARVSSFDSLVSFAMVPIGYALAGPLAAAEGVSTTLVIAAVFLAVPSGLVALDPSVRNAAVTVNRVPAPPPSSAG